jgi:hypothetical protein
VTARAAKAAAAKAKPLEQILVGDPTPIAELVLDDRNARRGDVEALMAGLKEFGQHRAVVAQRGTKKILVGNHMTLAAAALGWSQVGVAWVDDDDQTAKRRALSDNFIADRSKWDETQLAISLAELEDDVLLALPGLDEKLSDKLLRGSEPEEEESPVFPLVPRPAEAYSYVVVIAKNDVDGLWLREVMGVQEMKSWKSTKIAESRVIDVDLFKTALNNAIARGEPFG